MADEDEEWDGPVVEASQPLGERLETLEAGGIPEDVTEAVPPIEERVARLERIAEYLYSARKKASSLTSSVQTLADATKSLVDMLALVEAQQKRIEVLGERFDESEAGTAVFRRKTVRRVLSGALAFLLLVGVVGGGLLVFQRNQVAEAEWRCEARNEQSEITTAILRSLLVDADESLPQAQGLRRGLERSEALIVDCEGSSG